MVNIGLLLQQSYNDAWSDYRRSLDGEIQIWDYLELTASNESQAEPYRAQLDSCLQYPPKSTKCLAIPDAGGKRIGGGFLQIIKEKGITDGQIHERLKEYFGDSGIDIWKTEFSKVGHSNE